MFIPVQCDRRVIFYVPQILLLPEVPVSRNRYPVLRRLKWISGGLKLALARNGGNLQFLWCLRDEKSAWQSVATVIEPCFRQEFHGGHRAHEQARIKTQAASGSG